MPLSGEDLLKAIRHLSDADQLKVTIQGSVYGSLFVAFTCMVCSLIFGPIGIIVGAIVGSFLAYNKLKGTYKPLSMVLDELSQEEKEKLLKDLEDIRSQIQVTDCVELILLLKSGGAGLLLKKKIFETVFNFVKSKLKLKIN